MSWQLRGHSELSWFYLTIWVHFWRCPPSIRSETLHSLHSQGKSHFCLMSNTRQLYKNSSSLYVQSWHDFASQRPTTDPGMFAREESQGRWWTSSWFISIHKHFAVPEGAARLCVRTAGRWSCVKEENIQRWERVKMMRPHEVGADSSLQQVDGGLVSLPYS